MPLSIKQKKIIRFKGILNMKEKYLAQLYKKGKKVFNSSESFTAWLNRPSLDLNGKRPIDTIQSQSDIDQIIKILGRIEHGVLS